MSLKKQVATILLLIIAVVSLSGWLSNVVGSREDDYYDDLRMKILLFSNVFDAIRERYVEEVDTDKVIKAAIDGILERLDPYTEYLESEEASSIQIMSEGEYGGVGTRIGLRNGWCTVVEQPFDGKPAFKAGIREGDQILEVDGISTRNEDLDKTANRMRGKPGTEVRLKIGREGVPEPIEFRLIRDTIVVEDVNCATIIGDGIGYIRLTRFGRNAGKEVENAIESLKARGLKRLIFDLRSNPGGLLETAVEVADNFIEKDKLIVYTKGRWQGASKEYRAKTEPVLGDMPLVVLVDHFSASASEIVAGAIQDLDRGVIIGNTTFGKGVVQTVVGVSRNAMLKMTSAEYFIPSGRLIQNPNIYPRGAMSVFSDTSFYGTVGEEELTKKEFKTLSGRKVYGGGGIVPDIEVIADTLNNLELALLRRSMFFNFAVRYVQKHGDLPRSLVVGDKLLDEFKTFLGETDFEFSVEGEGELSSFERSARERGYYDAVASHIAELKEVIERDKENDFEESRDFIRWSLERELVSKLHGTAAGIEAVLDDDEVVQRAVELVSDSEKYLAVFGKKPGIGN